MRNFSKIPIVLTVMLCGYPCVWAGNNPSHGLIELAYFKCDASRNLKCGIFGKGPFKNFGPKRAACSSRQWVKISHEEFKALATEWYGFNWDNEGPWWNRELSPQGQPADQSNACRDVQTALKSYEIQKHFIGTIDAVTSEDTRRKRYYFEFNAGPKKNGKVSKIGFILYESRGVEKFLQELNATFDTTQFVIKKTAYNLRKEIKYHLYTIKVEDGLQNIAIRSDDGTFCWVNDSKPYPDL